MQVKNHFLARAEGSWLSVFTFYEPVLRVEILVKSFFFEVCFFTGFIFNIHYENKTLLIYQRKKPERVTHDLFVQ